MQANYYLCFIYLCSLSDWFASFCWHILWIYWGCPWPQHSMPVCPSACSPLLMGSAIVSYRFPILISALLLLVFGWGISSGLLALMPCAPGLLCALPAAWFWKWMLLTHFPSFAQHLWAGPWAIGSLIIHTDAYSAHAIVAAAVHPVRTPATVSSISDSCCPCGRSPT